ncbi:hypothetical protein [Sphingomonas crocodyli]|uniref:Uncharacterized protein n=1 Tax=Sphingomonas crocodyli TaxID=1979270 RepID=A0A437LYJ7_9SPHN|nr:hypothetical protein [Sphingomonas crocodyli]RVT90435.1 hypothetical protein EOD43_19450 [Sphingomonas crocodyli]
MPGRVEWTPADLDLIQSLDKAGEPVAVISRRVGRAEHLVEAALPDVRKRPQKLPTPARREVDDWLGPDEEGEVLPPSGPVDDDHAAWVHGKPGT